MAVYVYLIAGGVINLAMLGYLRGVLSQPRGEGSEAQQSALDAFARGLHRHGVIAGLLIVVGLVAAFAGWSDMTTMVAFLVLIGVAFLSMAIAIIGALPAMKTAQEEAKRRAAATS